LSEKSTRIDGRHRRRCKVNIKIDVEGAGYETVDKIQMVLKKIMKHQEYEQTDVGDRNTSKHDIIHEAQNPAKDRKQKTRNRSVKTSYMMLTSFYIY
jgi:hypothetical protein